MKVDKQMENQKSESKDELTDDQLRDELKSVDLSNIEVPSAKIHANWESLFQIAQLKVTEELGPEFKLSIDISNFSFYVFPSLSYDLMSSILIYNMAGFMLDDYLDKFPNENEKLIQQLRSKDFPGNGINDKWWRLCMKVCTEIMGETALDRLLDNFILCLSKAIEVSGLYTGEAVLPDDEYVRLRIVDSGAPHQFFLVFIGAGMQFRKELQNDSDYLGLKRQVALHVTLINDLYSLRKEIRDGIYRYNYVYVKMKNWNISAQAAVNEIILEIDVADRMARVYGERIKERNDPNLSRYVEGLYDVMAGNHYWSTICKRYNRL